MIILDTSVAVELLRGLPLHTFNTRHYVGIADLRTVQPYHR